MTDEITHKLEFIRILYQFDEIKEAKNWLQQVESQNIMPVNVAFLNGSILIKKGQNKKSRESKDYFSSLDRVITSYKTWNIN